MNTEEMKHIIAKLLQDAQRIQQIEPNSGTASRIEEAKKALKSTEGTIKNAYLKDAVITRASR